MNERFNFERFFGERMMDRYFNLKKKNIFQTSNRLFIIYMFFINCMLIGGLIVLYIRDRDDIYKLFLVGILLMIVGGAFIIAVILAIKDVRNYNYLLKFGKIVKGKIVSSGIPFSNGIKVKASYFDCETEKQYIYISGSPKAMNPNKMRYFVRTYPEIYLLIDEKNKKKGVVLIDEYYMEMLEKHGDEPYQSKNLFGR